MTNSDVMKQYCVAIFAWIVFLSGLFGTAFVVIRVISPYVVQLVLHKQAWLDSAAVGVIRVVSFVLIFFVLSVCYGLFFTRFELGRALLRRFVEINKRIGLNIFRLKFPAKFS